MGKDYVNICQTADQGNPCKRMDDYGQCCTYGREGQKFRQRQGYCPFIIKVVEENPFNKVRVGQQKQKKKLK